MPRAYLGVTVPGFPNLFLLYGPNTNGGTGSVVATIEAAMRHVIAALRELERRGARTIEVRREAAEAFDRSLREALAGTVWHAGCTNWYVDEHGNDPNQWPWTWGELPPADGAPRPARRTRYKRLTAREAGVEVVPERRCRSRRRSSTGRPRAPSRTDGKSISPLSRSRRTIPRRSKSAMPFWSSTNASPTCLPRWPPPLVGEPSASAWRASASVSRARASRSAASRSATQGNCSRASSSV